MCGIVGIVGKSSTPLKNKVEIMRDIFSYRGPDAKGTWVNDCENIALGHRRLSILDVSSAGNQPMSDSEERLWLVYNGEIYNYLELKQILENKGYSFHTRTDTEVLLIAYKEWGYECLSRLNGMWAFAIWDKKKNSLFIARDRLGIKPLYYHVNNNVFYFASEVKAILAVLEKNPGINEQFIDTYMSFGYVPGQDTLCKGIKRLLPGYYMEVTPKKHTVKKYWDLNFQNEKDLGLSYYLDRSKELLNNAIDLRLRSDVPLGIFLSGGIDSSAVVGLLAKRVPDRLKTFSVAYDFGPQYNETPYARLVAEKFNTEHHEVFVTPQQFQDFIPKFVRLMDEPVTEAAAISLYFVSKLAKEHVTVVLSGEGSDEIFGGYDLYRYMIILEKYRKIIGRPSTELLAKLAMKFLPAGNKLCKYLLLGSRPLEKRYKGISTYEEHYKKGLYSKEFAEICRGSNESQSPQIFLENLFNSTQNYDILSRMLYFDIKTWLVDDLLIKADRMSMAASLELRVPFLDFRLVEFAAQIPSRYKIKGNSGKYILKEMMQDTLPNKVISRKKMGFPTPLKIMFENKLHGYAKDLLLSPMAMIRPYFQSKQIEKLLQEHKSKKLDHHRVLWQLVVLENWFQEYKDKVNNLKHHK